VTADGGVLRYGDAASLSAPAAKARVVAGA
jgi:hypothetical protein